MARSCGAEAKNNDGYQVGQRKTSVTNADWIAGMMSALAIAALLWVAVAFA
jgi:hypothetical protein